MADLVHVEDMVKRLQDQKGVIGVLIADGSGVPVRTTMDHDMSTQYGFLSSELSRKARSLLKGALPEDDLLCVRLRSTENVEIIVAPDFMKDKGLSLVTVQKPDAS